MSMVFPQINWYSDITLICQQHILINHQPLAALSVVKPPSLSSTVGGDSITNYVAKNLNALHRARQAFIQQESCERLRRALCRKTRTYSNQVYNNGDSVYYHRNNAIQWHGPAKVLGRDGQQYLLKHGGIYIRVHPCRMQHVNNADGTTTKPDQINDVTEQSKRKLTEPVVESDDSSDDESTVKRAITPPLTPQSLPPDSPVVAADNLVPWNDTSNDDSNNDSNNDDTNNDDPTNVDSTNDDTTNGDTTIVNTKQDLPGKSSSILYRHKDKTAWQRGIVLGRAGKTTGGNWHFLNMKGDDDASSCVSFKDTEWKLVDPPAEEVYYGVASDGVRFDGPKSDELQKWKDMEAFEEVSDTGQPRISCRWVCTEKMKGSTPSLKARLVARGFEENTSQLHTDSPTCHKESLRLLLCILSAKSWRLHSLDIKSAFLQGSPIERELYLQPPKYANTDKVWKLKKCPYGLVDAGRNWYFRVRSELLDIGAHQSRLDQASFCWFDNGILCGIMIVHVDDFLYGGTPNFHSSVVNRIKQIFTVGLEESVGMKYLGLLIQETSDGIVLSAGDYSTTVKEFDTSIIGYQKDRPLLAAEITNLKQLSGQLNWVTTQCRPDLAFENCIVGNSIKNATVRDLFFANKAVRKLNANQLHLHFPKGFDLKSCAIIVFCDASFANLPDRGSQGGHIIFLVDKAGLYCPLSWQSRRIRRVVNSTLAAECLAAVAAVEASVLLSATVKEFLYHATTETPQLAISVLCDNKSLVDAVHSSTTVENKRLQIDISVLRDMIHRKEISEFRWVPTQLQVANPLTKIGCSLQYLVDILNHRKRFSVSSGAFE